MINAVINKLYFKQLNIQFHPDVLHDQNFASGLKRRILEKILSDNKEIDNINRFFNDLDRLNAIIKYFGNPPSDNVSFQNNINAITDYKNNDAVNAYDNLHHEFILIAEKIELQLVKVLNS